MKKSPKGNADFIFLQILNLQNYGKENFIENLYTIRNYSCTIYVSKSTAIFFLFENPSHTQIMASIA